MDIPQWRLTQRTESRAEQCGRVDASMELSFCKVPLYTGAFASCWFWTITLHQASLLEMLTGSGRFLVESLGSLYKNSAICKWGCFHLLLSALLPLFLVWSKTLITTLKKNGREGHLVSSQVLKEMFFIFLNSTLAYSLYYTELLLIYSEGSPRPQGFYLDPMFNFVKCFFPPVSIKMNICFLILVYLQSIAYAEPISCIFEMRSIGHVIEFSLSILGFAL